MNPKSYVVTWTPRFNKYCLKHRLDLDMSIANYRRIQIHGWLDVTNNDDIYEWNQAVLLRFDKSYSQLSLLITLHLLRKINRHHWFCFLIIVFFDNDLVFISITSPQWSAQFFSAFKQAIWNESNKAVRSLL
jgi:hypothetical protein